MKRLACVALPLLAFATLSCAALQKEPGQVKEPLPTVSDAAASKKSLPDMVGPDGKPIAEPLEAPSEAFQPIGGTFGGKPWQLKGAGTLEPIRGDGYVQIVLANYPIDCGHHEPTPDDRTITLTIPWKAKTRLDLGKLKAKESSATQMDEKKKKPVAVRGWKPKGTLDVLAAPTRMKSSGRIKIELTSGKDTSLSAEVPVRLCYVN
jgi:hypothetical protein